MDLTTGNKDVQLLRVYLPENHTTLLQVKKDMEMKEILNTVCEKKMLDVETHSLFVIADDHELEALPNDKYELYVQATEIRVKQKSDGTSNKDFLGPRRRSGRRASIQLNAPKAEIKMGGFEFPSTIMDDGKNSVSLRRASRTITALSSIFKRLGDESKSGFNGSSGSLASDSSPRTTQESFGAMERSSSVDRDKSLGSSESFPSNRTTEQSPPIGSVTSKISITTGLETPADLDIIDEPASPLTGTSVQFLRKRNNSAGVKVSTLKRNTFRARSASEQIHLQKDHNLKETPDNSALIRFEVENEFTTMKIPVSNLLEVVLRDVAEKFNIPYDEYTIEFPDGTRGDLDRSLQYYLQNAKVAELKIVRGEKSFSTMSIVENGEEVLVLAIQKDRKIVMAGTPEKLIERATDESEIDMQFTDTFLLTFRSFMKPLDVFDELIARFNATLPSDPSLEDVQFFEKSKGHTQMKVVDIMKWWTRHHWHDFAFNPVLKTDLEDFVEVLGSIPEFAKYKKELDEIIELQMEREEQIQVMHKSIDSKKKTMESMFDDVEIDELAKQICLHNFELFKNIHPIEFLSQIWRKKDSGMEWSTPNLDFFSSRFDRESYWVATEILSQKDLKRRVNYLKRFIYLGKECLVLNNFFSMFAIYVGLNLTPIQRLKKTWENLSPKVKQVYDELEKACDPSKNMKGYRDLLAACKPPILSFLPIYLKDLTFMNDGNSSTFKNMINFDKLRMMADRVRDITDLSKSPYTFEPIPAVQNYLHKPHIEMNLQKLKEESLKCES